MKAKKYGKLLALACVTMLSVSAFTACSNDEEDSSSDSSSTYSSDSEDTILPIRIAQMLPIPAALIPAVQTLLWILQRTAVILIAWTLTVPAPTIWIPTVPRRNKTYVVSELF